jgi:hypothetical protein
MKPATAALATLTLALTLALALAPSRVEAQVATPYGSWTYTSGTPSFTPIYMPSYSYWTAAYYGYPPRVYSGYGNNDFPYYGRPYGSPSDPWSWPAMGGYSYAVPTRYNLGYP